MHKQIRFWNKPPERLFSTPQQRWVSLLRARSREAHKSCRTSERKGSDTINCISSVAARAPAFIYFLAELCVCYSVRERVNFLLRQMQFVHGRVHETHNLTDSIQLPSARTGCNMPPLYNAAALLCAPSCWSQIYILLYGTPTNARALCTIYSVLYQARVYLPRLQL